MTDDLTHPTWGTVRALNERIAELEDHNRQLKISLAAIAIKPLDPEVLAIRLRLRCTPQMGRFLIALYNSHEPMPRKRMHAALESRSQTNSVSVQASRIRRLFPGWLIQHGGRGYTLSDEGRSAIAEILQRQQGRAA